LNGLDRFRSYKAILGIYREGRYIPSHTRGVSDIIGCIPKQGRYLAIEVKRPGGKLTPEQQQFIDIINAVGGLAFVAHLVDEVIVRLPAAWVLHR